MKPDARRPRPKKDYLAHLDRDIYATGLPVPEREVRFLAARKWKFDRAWLAWRVACEYEGGIFDDISGHKSATGLLRDMQKYNEAALAGWLLIRVNAQSVATGQAVSWIARALSLRAGSVADVETALPHPGPVRRSLPLASPVRRKVLG